MKKSFSIVLAVLMLLSVLSLVSCGDKTDPSVTTQAPAVNTENNPGEVTTAAITFPEKNYNDETFTVYFRDHAASSYKGFYIIPEEDTGDIIDSQAEKRNMMVEEKYHIKFVAKEATNPTSTLSKDISGNEVNYDIILDQRNKIKDYALKGLFFDFNKLDIDYSNPWWDSNCAKQYAIQNKLFFMVNDVSVSNIAGCRFYYFNKAVLEDFKLKSPYEYAASNEWTLDNFLNLVKGVNSPGDSENFGIYGLVNESGANLNHTLTGVGCFKSALDKDGNITCSLLDKDVMERASDYFDKMNAVFNDKTICLTMDEAHTQDSANAGSMNKYDHSRYLFSQGHFLFTQSSMNGTVNFGEMPRGYGVVMNPKYNPDQPAYYHMMDANANIWCVPKEDIYADRERLAVIMDYWAYCSTGTVMEAYYELTMKTKRASDPTAAEMLDTIKASIVYFPTDIYSCSSIGDLITNASKNGFTDGVLKTSQKAIEAQLKSFNTSIGKLKD